jgi:hypothetical protein
MGCMGHGPTLSSIWSTVHRGQCESHGDGTVLQNDDILHKHLRHFLLIQYGSLEGFHNSTVLMAVSGLLNVTPQIHIDMPH